MLKDRLALLFIRWARKLTTWGFTDDHLAEAQREQEVWIQYIKDMNHD